MLLQIFLPRFPGKSRFPVIGLYDVLPVADLLFPGFFLIITRGLHRTSLGVKIVGDGTLGLCHPCVIWAPVSGHHPPQISRSQHLCQLEEIAVPPGFPFLRFCFSCCDTQKHLLHFILKGHSESPIQYPAHTFYAKRTSVRAWFWGQPLSAFSKLVRIVPHARKD